MPYKESLRKATQLKKELDRFRPLSPEVENRIMQKFRLDWNYHSSHIEGNQLTYGETKALILFGQTAQAKPLKDHLEMTGHNEAIKHIEEVVKQERPLTENFIRELHQIILKEPYKVKAITPDGQPTERTISIGKYKTTPNHVKTITGEIFYFATPESTPAEMAELMQWYNTRKDSDELHPVLFATEFHYRFIRIHPFDDGNGRIARLLMNFILMQNGYPPSIIKTEDKESYFAALRQADAGQLEYFFNYVCEQVNYSLELMIKAAKGENIDEEDDLDKKLALLKQEVEAEDKENEIQINLTVNAVHNALNNWGYDLFTQLVSTTSKFNDFYDKSEHYVSLMMDGTGPGMKVNKELLFDTFDSEFDKLDPRKSLHGANFKFRCIFSAYKKGGLNPFGCNYTVEVKFEQYHYEIFVGYFDHEGQGQITRSFTKKLLHKPLLPKEIKDIDKLWGETLFNHLEYYRKHQNGNDKI